MNENVKFMYEKAIEAYESSATKIKSKIIGYSTVIVVLFTLYISYAGKGFIGLPIVIVLIGLILSICAIYSFWGASAWQKSWEMILAHHENLFIKDSGLSDNNRLYTVVSNGELFYSSGRIIEFIFGCTIAAWIILLFKEAFVLSMKVFFYGYSSCFGTMSEATFYNYYSKWTLIYLGIVFVCLLAMVFLFLRNKKATDFVTNTDYMFKLDDDKITK